MALNYPSVDYPIEVRRKIDRGWRRRTAAARVRTGAIEHARAGVCALCHVPAPIAPIASVARGAGLIDHHWLCVPCGHVWTTAVQMTGAKT